MPTSSYYPGQPTSEESLQAITDRLAAWTAENLPRYPWRHGDDPYAVWVAVVMLQQTQVATVLPYYDRFLHRFPSVRDLASASLDEVLKAWEGLGYYARARNLRSAAVSIVKNNDGAIPQSREELLSLPGIGDYTASAILSIAFGAEIPAIDGNVRRVLCRLFAVGEDTRRKAGRRWLYAMAQRLLPAGSAGEFNQGLMEFGAAVCTARSPACDSCPLGDRCESRRLGKEKEIPCRPARRKVPQHTVTAALIWNEDGRVLLARRPANAMLGGMWEFPGGKREKDESLEECLRREIREELGLVVRVEDAAATVRHAYSHFSIILHAYHCRLVSGEPRALGCAEWRWVSWTDLGQFPISGADLKVIAAFEGPCLAEG